MVEPYNDIRNKKILYVVLNWGLGHASRSIPLIDKLSHKNEVHIASDGIAWTLLNQEFPKLIIHTLPGYNIQYKGSNLVIEMVTQLPKIYIAYTKENKRIKSLHEEYNYDLVISDHRYGGYIVGRKNIFLAHQLNILSSSPFLSKIATFINRRLINVFEEVWVPDFEDSRLSGKLSYPNKLKSNTTFIGPLSRMNKGSDTRYQYDVGVILSGPEPARSNLERAIRKEMENVDLNVVIVRGTDTESECEASAHEVVYNLLPYVELNQVINSCKTIICRSGYSSIMDMVALDKKAILIPTPGQTEQEYLASHLSPLANFKTLKESEIHQLVSMLPI